MSDVVIGAEIQVNSGNSAPSVKQVRDEIKGLKEELDGVKAGSKEHTEILGKMKAANEQLNPTIKEQGSTFSAVKDQLSASVPAFKGATEGASGFGSMLKALLANPIVLLIAAIVAGLKFLYEAFKNTFEGGEKLEQIFAGISAAATVVTDRVFALGRSIIKFFSGDFKGAMTDAKAAVSGVGDEVARVYTRTAELTKQLQNIRREERADELDKAEREKRLALLREQLNDETVPIAKRKAIALELRKDQEKNAVEDLERSKRKAAAQIALLSQEKDGEKKHADEINEIRVGILKTETENALEGVRTNKVIRNLDHQQKLQEIERDKAAKEKRREEKKRADEKKREEDKRLKAEEQRRKRVGLIETASLKEEYDKEAAIKEEKANEDRTKKGLEYAAKFTNGLKEFSDARIATDKAEAEAKEQTITAVGGALNAVADLIGKQTVAGKALAVASSIINTYQGATKALAQGGIAGIAGAIAVIAAGMASVKNIIATKVPNQSDSVSGGSSISTSAPLQPQATAQTTRLPQDQINQMGNAAVRAYVVTTDINNDQQKIQQINRAARLN